MSLNSVTLVGHLGKDPESRQAKGGTSIVNFSMATTRKAKGPDGQWADETEWHRCTCFGHTADFVEKYLKKGRLVCVQGRIKSGKYTDKNGIERISYDIICDTVQALGRGDDAGQSRAPNQTNNTRAQSHTQSAPDDSGFGGGFDDIPF